MISHVCPHDETLPPKKVCFVNGHTPKDIEIYLTAQFNKNHDCEGDCTFWAIVNVSELGPCPNKPGETEYIVKVSLGCIDLTQQPFYFSEKTINDEFLDIILKDAPFHKSEK